MNFPYPKRDPPEFTNLKKIHSKYEQTSACMAVWSKNALMFRCRDCGFLPSMSLCSECFFAADHTGHDISIEISGGGGACDCGLSSVMKKEFFCQNHKADETMKSFVKPYPEFLTCGALNTIPIIFKMLSTECFYQLGIIQETNSSHLAPELSKGLRILNEFADISFLTKKLLVDYLLQPQSFPSKRDISSIEKYIKYLKSERWLSDYSRNRWTANDSSPENFDLFKPENLASEFFSTRLRELFFWMIVFGYPEELVSFFLSLFHEQRYKEQLFLCALDFYPLAYYIIHRESTRFGLASNDRHASEKLNHLFQRISQLNVQLFVSSELVNFALEKRPNAVQNIFKLVYLGLLDESGNPLDFQAFAKIDNENAHFSDLKLKAHWTYCADLANMLATPSAQSAFFTDVQTFIEIVKILQTSMIITRKDKEMVAYDNFDHFFDVLLMMKDVINNQISAIFYRDEWLDQLTPEQLENAFLYIKSGFRAVLEKSGNSSENKKDEVENAEVSQAEKLSSLDIPDSTFSFLSSKISDTSNEVKTITFSLPLQRFVSTFLYKIVTKVSTNQALSLLKELDIQESWFSGIIDLARSSFEIHQNMWVYNGEKLKHLIRFHQHQFFCHWFIDADIHFIQLYLSTLDTQEQTDKFVEYYLAKFSNFNENYGVTCMKEFLSEKFPDALESMPNQSKEDQLKQDYIGESAINFLLEILSSREYMSMLSKEERCKYEIVSCLATKAKPEPHSVFTKQMWMISDAQAPYYLSYTKIVDEMYPEVTKKVENSCFDVTDFAWENYFCPVLTAQRCKNLNELQNAFQRFEQFKQQKNAKVTYDASCLPTVLLSPIRDLYLPVKRILYSKVLWKTIISKILYDNAPGNSRHIKPFNTPKYLYYAFWLIENALANADTRDLSWLRFWNHSPWDDKKTALSCLFGIYQDAFQKEKYQDLLAKKELELLDEITGDNETIRIGVKEVKIDQELLPEPYYYDEKNQMRIREIPPFQKFSRIGKIFRIFTAIVKLKDVNLNAQIYKLFNEKIDLKPIPIDDSSKEKKKAKALRGFNKMVKRMKMKSINFGEMEDVTNQDEDLEHSEFTNYQNSLSDIYSQYPIYEDISTIKCVICNQNCFDISETNLKINPIGLVCRIDPIIATDEDEIISNGEQVEPDEELRQSLSKAHFSSDYFRNITTCGHYIHAKCAEPLKNITPSRLLMNASDNPQNFSCPVCRQSSNHVLVLNDCTPIQNGQIIHPASDSSPWHNIFDLVNPETYPRLCEKIKNTAPVDILYGLLRFQVERLNRNSLLTEGNAVHITRHVPMRALLLKLALYDVTYKGDKVDFISNCRIKIFLSKLVKNFPFTENQYLTWTENLVKNSSSELLDLQMAALLYQQLFSVEKITTIESSSPETEQKMLLKYLKIENENIKIRSDIKFVPKKLTKPEKDFIRLFHDQISPLEMLKQPEDFCPAICLCCGEEIMNNTPANTSLPPGNLFILKQQEMIVHSKIHNCHAVYLDIRSTWVYIIRGTQLGPLENFFINLTILICLKFSKNYLF